MRVVDDDPERLARIDALHPPGHALDRLEAAADGGRVKPEALAQRDHRERVVDVEPPGEPELQAPGRPRRPRSRPGAARVLLDRGRPDVGGGSVP